MNPVAHIQINGFSAEELDKRIKSVKLGDNAGTANDTVEIDLEDVDRSAMIPEEGDKISVFLGYEQKDGHTNPPDSDPKFMGTFILDEVKWGGPPDILTLVGHGFDTGKDFKGPWTEDYHQQKLGDVVTKVLERNGFVARVHNDLGTIFCYHLQQNNVSDMAFLEQLAHEFGAEFKICDDQGYFAPLGKMAEIGLSLGPQELSVTLDMLSTYRFTRQSRSQFAEVQVRVHNLSEDDTTLESSEDESDSDARYPAVLELPSSIPDPTLAGLKAKTTARKLKHARHQFNFTAVGHPDFRAETYVTVEGMREGLPGRWLIAKAQHDFTDEGGYVVAVECVIDE